MIDESTQELTRAMARGNENAFRRFFAAYFHRLHAYTQKLTRENSALSEDISQEVLLRVARNIKPFETEEALWCWLVLLARCAFIDAVRKEKRYAGLLENYQTEREIEKTPLGRSIDSSEALHSALKRLRPKERKLLMAKYRDDASYREIAASLGVSEKAVESKLGRIRIKLRKILTGGLRNG